MYSIMPLKSGLVEQYDLPPEYIHQRLADAVNLDIGDPNRDTRIYGASMLFAAATGDVDEAIALYNQYATHQL